MTDYSLLSRQLEELTSGESCYLPNLSNASSLLFHTLADVNWAGFYLVSGQKLILGPFQGQPACIRIPFGKGVCGTAAQLDCVQRIDDVHQFPGHIACDGASNSEIVIPIHSGQRVVGVLDIDSPVLNRFSMEDEQGLLHLVHILETVCRFNFKEV